MFAKNVIYLMSKILCLSSVFILDMKFRFACGEWNVCKIQVLLPKKCLKIWFLLFIFLKMIQLSENNTNSTKTMSYLWKKSAQGKTESSQKSIFDQYPTYQNNVTQHCSVWNCSRTLQFDLCCEDLWKTLKLQKYQNIKFEIDWCEL